MVRTVWIGGRPAWPSGLGGRLARGLWLRRGSGTYIRRRLAGAESRPQRKRNRVHRCSGSHELIFVQLSATCHPSLANIWHLMVFLYCFPTHQWFLSPSSCFYSGFLTPSCCTWSGNTTKNPNPTTFEVSLLLTYVGNCFMSCINVFPAFRCCSARCFSETWERVEFCPLCACLTGLSAQSMATSPALLCIPSLLVFFSCFYTTPCILLVAIPPPLQLAIFSWISDTLHQIPRSGPGNAWQRLKKLRNGITEDKCVPCFNILIVSPCITRLCTFLEVCLPHFAKTLLLCTLFPAHAGPQVSTKLLLASFLRGFRLCAY